MKQGGVAGSDAHALRGLLCWARATRFPVGTGDSLTLREAFFYPEKGVFPSGCGSILGQLDQEA